MLLAIPSSFLDGPESSPELHPGLGGQSFQHLPVRGVHFLGFESA